MTRDKAERFADALQDFVCLHAEGIVGFDQAGDAERRHDARERLVSLLTDDPPVFHEQREAVHTGMFDPRR